MSLATRCSACGTVFRVVKDQLRVSEGWVRCGRCAEVFNAIENLVDLEVDRPGADAEPSANGARVMNELAQMGVPQQQQPAEIDEAQGGGVVADDDSADVRSEDADPVPAPADAVAATDEGEPEPALTGSSGEIVATEAAAGDEAVGSANDILVHKPPASLARSKRRKVGRASGATGRDASQPRSDRTDTDLLGRPVRSVTPGFVRQADSAARWRRPGVRWLLGATALTASLTLTLQAVLVWHDVVVARWPASTPALERLCAYQGCKIEAPRQIEHLTVDSSGLVRAGSSGEYRLALVMRNREPAMALRVPAVDLTVTDAAGQTIARRVIDAHSLGAGSDRIAAGAELALSRTLIIEDGLVAGYTIELFYP